MKQTSARCQTSPSLFSQCSSDFWTSAHLCQVKYVCPPQSSLSLFLSEHKCCSSFFTASKFNFILIFVVQVGSAVVDCDKNSTFNTSVISSPFPMSLSCLILNFSVIIRPIFLFCNHAIIVLVQMILPYLSSPVNPFTTSFSCSLSLSDSMSFPTLRTSPR